MEWWSACNHGRSNGVEMEGVVEYRKGVRNEQAIPRCLPSGTPAAA